MHFLMYLLAVALQAPDSGAFVITLAKTRSAWSVTHAPPTDWWTTWSCATGRP